MSEFFYSSNTGGGGGSTMGASVSMEYIIDAFQDFSVPASNNTGLTDNSSTNPLGANFANTDTPFKGSKTLFIKDFKLVVDRSKWIAGIPTYEIIWTEEYPNVKGFFFGEGVIKNGINNLPYLRVTRGRAQYGRTGFAVTGIGKNASVLFSLNGAGNGDTPPTYSTYIDGSVNQTTQTPLNPSGADFAEYNTTSLYTAGMVKYIPTRLASADQAVGLHTFSLEAEVQAPAIDISGVVFEHGEEFGALANRPGVTYVNRSRVETGVGATFAAPSVGSSLGGQLIVAKAAGGYTLVPFGISTIASIGQGTNGTNTVNVSAGHGQSFQIGNGIAIVGTTTYVGAIASISTDTLVVSPTLPFGVSGTLFRLWKQGPSLSISSSYQAKRIIRFNDSFATQNNRHGGFGPTLTPSSTLNQFESIYSPENEYAVYGQNLNLVNMGATMGAPSDSPFKYYPDYDAGVQALQFAGNSGWLQVDGNFQAAKVNLFRGDTFAETSIISLEVNGLVGFSMALGGTLYLTPVFVMGEAQAGWNSFRLTMRDGVGSSEFGIHSVELYKYAPGAAGLTASVLGELYQLPGGTPHALGGFRGMPLGTAKRLYWPDMSANGSVASGTMPALSVGSGQSPPQDNTALNTGWRPSSTGNSAVIRFSYYGKDFYVGGTMGSGQTLAVLLDGVTVGTQLNQYYVGATTKFHDVQVRFLSYIPTTRVSYADIVAPYSEVDSLQKVEAFKQRKKKRVLIPKVSPWIPYQQIVTGLSTSPVIVADVNKNFWRQNGENLEFFSYTKKDGSAGGSRGGGYYLWDLPLNFKIRPDFFDNDYLGSSLFENGPLGMGRAEFFNVPAYGSGIGVMSVINERQFSVMLQQGAGSVFTWAGGSFFPYGASGDVAFHHYISDPIPVAQFAGKKAYDTIWVDEIEDMEDSLS